MRIVIDRIEENFAVAELPDGSMKNLPLEFVPDCKEGDVVYITIDEEETKKIKEDVRIRLDSLFDE